MEGEKNQLILMHGVSMKSRSWLPLAESTWRHHPHTIQSKLHCTLGEHIWDLLTQCINFYSHSLIFPVILPSLIICNLFIWWYRWLSGEKYYHFMYFAFSVAQTVQKYKTKKNKCCRSSSQRDINILLNDWTISLLH